MKSLPDADLIKAGEEAADELETALGLVGVKFPSLRGDYPVRDKAMIRLGGCAADEALALAKWIRRHLS